MLSRHPCRLNHSFIYRVISPRDGSVIRARHSSLGVSIYTCLAPNSLHNKSRSLCNGYPPTMKAVCQYPKRNLTASNNVSRILNTIGFNVFGFLSAVLLTHDHMLSMLTTRSPSFMFSRTHVFLPANGAPYTMMCETIMYSLVTPKMQELYICRVQRYFIIVHVFFR